MQKANFRKSQICSIGLLLPNLPLLYCLLDNRVPLFSMYCFPRGGWLRGNNQWPSLATELSEMATGCSPSTNRLLESSTSRIKVLYYLASSKEAANLAIVTLLSKFGFCESLPFA